jgi:hypothetical protein
LAHVKWVHFFVSSIGSPVVCSFKIDKNTSLISVFFE